MVGGVGAAPGGIFAFLGFGFYVSSQAVCDAVLDVCDYLVSRLPVGVDVFSRFGLNVSEVDHVMALNPLCSHADVCHCVDCFLRLWRQVWYSLLLVKVTCPLTWPFGAPWNVGERFLRSLGRRPWSEVCDE